MSDKRRGLGRGLGALIPPAPTGAGARPTDVFFPEGQSSSSAKGSSFTGNHAGPQAGESRFTGNIAADRDDERAERPGGGAPESGATDDLKTVPGAQFAQLPVGSIRPNPRQPREVFDEDEMAELVHSVREIGVLQPVVVRPVEQDGDIRFELIMGERRLRAATSAGLEDIPAIVRSTADDDLLRDALLENLHRAALNPLEEAAAYQQLLDDFHCTHDELAARIGRSRPQISNTIRLLKLPPLVARRVAAGVISAGHARALLALPDGAAMERLAQRIVAEGLSVRSTEEIVTLGEDPPSARRSSPRPGNRHPELDDLAANLSDRLDTRVGISLGKRKGKLTVEFASVSDLNRIMEALGITAE